MENGNKKAESMRDEFLEICPDVIRMLQELIADPERRSCRFTHELKRYCIKGRKVL